ncbi:hypothetical protein EVAR_11992_1 [Eumeta japonica]|uniref:Uncharacterized protein n=1 Tax=Eumeta variegata TaxID=151549 RepID=A0A4C1U4Z7_EUMVA|nr:hypothetical protein EVAR_11992_1 [Eumeta japonica]
MLKKPTCRRKLIIVFRREVSVNSSRRALDDRGEFELGALRSELKFGSTRQREEGNTYKIKRGGGLRERAPARAPVGPRQRARADRQTFVTTSVRHKRAGYHPARRARRRTAHPHVPRPVTGSRARHFLCPA